MEFAEQLFDQFVDAVMGRDRYPEDRKVAGAFGVGTEPCYGEIDKMSVSGLVYNSWCSILKGYREMLSLSEVEKKHVVMALRKGDLPHKFRQWVEELAEASPHCHSYVHELVSREAWDDIPYDMEVLRTCAGSGIDDNDMVPEFTRGSKVRIQGLRQAQDLNGRIGTVVKDLHSGRYGVQVGAKAPVAVKGDNLSKAIVKVARLFAGGESGFVATEIMELDELLKLGGSRSPVSTLVGIPVNVTKVQPRSHLRDTKDYDNQWATFMMIDPESGLAPPKWQSMVGPVVLWRPEADFSIDDASIFNDYLNWLLDRYPNVTIGRDITPEAFEKQKKRSVRDGMQDVNI